MLSFSGIFVVASIPMPTQTKQFSSAKSGGIKGSVRQNEHPHWVNFGTVIAAYLAVDRGY